MPNPPSFRFVLIALHHMYFDSCFIRANSALSFSVFVCFFLSSAHRFSLCINTPPSRPHLHWFLSFFFFLISLWFLILICSHFVALLSHSSSVAVLLLLSNFKIKFSDSFYFLEFTSNRCNVKFLISYSMTAYASSQRYVQLF